jgi:hypothetical protein
VQDYRYGPTLTDEYRRVWKLPNPFFSFLDHAQVILPCHRLLAAHTTAAASLPLAYIVDASLPPARSPMPPPRPVAASSSASGPAPPHLVPGHLLARPPTPPPHPAAISSSASLLAPPHLVPSHRRSAAVARPPPPSQCRSATRGLPPGHHCPEGHCPVVALNPALRPPSLLTLVMFQSSQIL